MLRMKLLPLLLVLAFPALAQAPPAPPATAVVQGNIVIAVTNTGETTALPVTAGANSGALTYYNSGSKDAFCTPVATIGGVATTASLKIPATTYLTAWNTNLYSFASCITGGSDTTSVTIYQGNGPNQFGMVGGSGGGPSGVTSFNTRTGTVTLQAGDVSGVGGLLASNNLSDVGTPATALINIGGIGAATTNTLINKTISGASNTVSNIGNGSLTNSSVTIGSTACALGATCGTIAGLTLTAPALGAATATTINKLTLTQPATGSTLTIPDGVTLNAGAGGTLGSNAFTSTAYAPLTSPALTGTPTAPTAAVNTNTTQIATTAFVIGQGYGTGTGNANFGTATGNTSGHLVTMANTTTGIQDFGSAPGTAATQNTGTSGANLPFLNGANTWSGVQTVTQSDLALLGSSTGKTTLNSGLSGAGNNTLTLPTTATDTLAALATAETWTAVQTFTNSDIKILGSSTGTTTLTSANSGASNFTLTLPAATSTLATLAAQTFAGAQTFADGGVWNGSGITLGAAVTGAGFGMTGMGSITNTNNNGFGFGTGSCAAASTTVTLEPNRNTSTAGIGCNGVSGSVSITGGAGVVNLVATGAANTSIFLPSITTDATHTDSSLCQDTTTHGVYFGSGTVGICLGTSSARYKHDIHGLGAGIADIMALKPVQFRYNKDYIDSGVKEQYGFLAEDVVKGIPDLVGLDKGKRPNSVDILGIVPVLVNAVQTQQHEIYALTGAVVILFGWNLYLTVRK